FELWRAGVRLWLSEGGAAPALMRLRDELADLRRRQAPVPVDITRDRLAPFLAGFASAEAHFGASSAGSPIFVINVRS
ncbi:hypothetical protein NP569_27525, partial [Vibrio parahaemolyticus]|nr:hypothetical protein [Vibrio parahaemolyticus]